MSVRIIMERKIKEGKELELARLLRELRAKALHQPGYISGETLAAVDDPSVRIVLSTWRDVDAWRAWENHPERLKILSQIEPLLAAPTKTRVYIEV